MRSMKTHIHYTKLGWLLSVIFLTFTGSLSYAEGASPLLTMLGNVPQEAVYPQMNAPVISYADYRAIERANGVPNPASRAEFNLMDDSIQAWWQASLLRVHAGPPSFVNLTQDKIETMPELMGFDYFDMDQALVYGADPFVGTIVHSEDAAFSRARTAAALAARGYDSRWSAAGAAWGKGGDGMTDIDNIALGDPFGGDVGLASRVAVLDRHTIANSFLWAILLKTTEAHTGETPAYDALPEYRTMARALPPEAGELLQAFILSPGAGRRQQPNEGLPALPPYTLAAAADLQVGERQVHRLVLLYERAADAETALFQLPGRVAAFDNGWLDTLNFTAPRARIDSWGAYYAVTLDIAAPAPSPQEVQNGAFEPGLVFGFWATAIRQGQFFPLALG